MTRTNEELRRYLDVKIVHHIRRVYGLGTIVVLVECSQAQIMCLCRQHAKFTSIPLLREFFFRQCPRFVSSTDSLPIDRAFSLPLSRSSFGRSNVDAIKLSLIENEPIAASSPYEAVVRLHKISEDYSRLDRISLVLGRRRRLHLQPLATSSSRVSYFMFP